jgi:uncharacterized protein (TIGR02646 family)
VIRIVKPEVGPAILVEPDGAGRAHTQDICAQYDIGERDLKFKSSIYAHHSVKAILRAAQHDKCCFCESKFAHISPGDVEHFRPKKGWCQNPTDPISKPGYYWLAYDWGNLLLCCSLCNSRYKRNHFPLSNPQRRAHSHHDDISAERPLFVHPATDDPERFITFHEHVAVPVGNSRRGKATIKSLGLNRRELRDYRMRMLRHIRLLVESLAGLEECQKKAPENVDVVNQITMVRQHLETLTNPDAEYCSMNRSFLAGKI